MMRSVFVNAEEGRLMLLTKQCTQTATRVLKLTFNRRSGNKISQDCEYGTKSVMNVSNIQCNCGNYLEFKG